MPYGNLINMDGARADHLSASAEPFAGPPSYHDTAIHIAVPTTEGEWKSVLKNNTSCLKGITVSRQGGAPEMAQYTAFQFDYDSSVGPEHVQDEKTEIRVQKIRSESEQQMSLMALSERELEAFLRCVATGSGLGFQMRDACFTHQSRSSKTQKLEVSHWHPKFILFLDERSLSITEDCQARLTQLKESEDKEQAVAFLQDFGEGFAQQATIGGRLFYSENVGMLEGDALEKRENSLKIAAKASLSSVNSTSKSASINLETQTLHKDTLKTSSSSEGMLWSGVGGDPRLHEDPGAWIASLTTNKPSWKIIEKRCIVSLPLLLSKFTGYEWAPAKFEQMLRPTLSSFPQLAHADESRIGSSIAIFTQWDIFKQQAQPVFAAFQNRAGYIKFGYVNMKQDTSESDMVSVYTIARARLNTPLVCHRHKYPSPSVIYVTEHGILADQTLDRGTGAWYYGHLLDLKLQVAFHSNIASCATRRGLYVCFEDQSGNLRLVNPDGTVEDVKGDLDLNILPGTALAIEAREPFRQKPSALAIGFQTRDRKLMALGRERDGEWTVFELSAPGFTADFDPRPWGRSSVLFTLGLYPPTVGDSFCLDSTNRLVHVPSGLSVLRPLRTIWPDSRYAYADQTLVYMSSSGRIECTARPTRAISKRIWNILSNIGS